MFEDISTVANIDDAPLWSPVSTAPAMAPVGRPGTARPPQPRAHRAAFSFTPR